MCMSVASTSNFMGSGSLPFTSSNHDSLIPSQAGVKNSGRVSATDLNVKTLISEITMDDDDFQTILNQEVALRANVKGDFDFEPEDIEKISKKMIYRLTLLEARRNGALLTESEKNLIQKSIAILICSTISSIPQQVEQEQELEYFPYTFRDTQTGISTTHRIYLKTDANAICDARTRNTWLHIAAETGNELLLKGFIKYGGTSVNMEARNSEDLTPLMLALRDEKEKSVAILLEAGADVHALSEKYGSVLHVAAQTNARIIDVIFQKREGSLNWELENMEGETPIFSAVKVDRIEVAEKLIRAGVDIHKFNTLRTAYPLSIAASEGQTKIAKLLLENGATINKYNTKYCNDITPLFQAVTSEKTDVELIHALIAAGDDPHRRLIDNKGLISFVNMRVSPEKILRTLLGEYQVKLDREAIWRTDCEGGFRQIKILLEHGVDPNVVLETGTYFMGCTLLGKCSMGFCRDDAEKIIELLNHGADPNAINRTGSGGIAGYFYMTSFATFAHSHCCEKRYLAPRAFELTQLFLSKGAKIDSQIKKYFDGSYVVKNNPQFRQFIDNHYQGCTIM